MVQRRVVRAGEGPIVLCKNLDVAGRVRTTEPRTGKCGEAAARCCAAGRSSDKGIDVAGHNRWGQKGPINGRATWPSGVCELMALSG